MRQDMINEEWIEEHAARKSCLWNILTLLECDTDADEILFKIKIDGGKIDYDVLQKISEKLEYLKCLYEKRSK
jgi:hypothetical protein